jgi:hypothetical protein
VSTSPLRPDGPFGRFADRLLVDELPDLEPARRSETVTFVCRRAGELPTPLLFGVATMSIGTGIVARVVGMERVTDLLRGTRLPLVGELARMVRSLGFTFVWETWPDTSPTGEAHEDAR